jgi:hypothetical protein
VPKMKPNTPAFLVEASITKSCYNAIGKLPKSAQKRVLEHLNSAYGRARPSTTEGDGSQAESAEADAEAVLEEELPSDATQGDF